MHPMPLHEGLELLRAAFSQAADEVDAALAAWTDAPAGNDASGPCETVVATLDQLAEASRLIGLEGQALAAERLRDTAQLCAMADEAEAGAMLAWLTLWRQPMSEVFDQPGDTEATQTLLEYLSLSPLPLSAEGAEALRAELLPGIQHASCADRAGPVTHEPTLDDVSLELPQDIDPELFDTFVAQAPDQLAVLAEAVQALLAGRADAELLAEAQRVAHTFKGSGNIIGIVGVGRLAHRVEDMLDFAQARGGRLPVAMAQDLLDASHTLEQMIAALRGEEAAPQQALAVLRKLQAWSAQIARGEVPELSDEPEGSDTGGPRPTAPGDDPANAAAPAVRHPTDPPALLQVDAAQLDQLARSAGQHAVAQAQMADTVRQIDQRLAALQATQLTLQTRITELQAQLGDAGTPGADDPGELRSLARLAAEMVADGRDITEASRADLRGLQDRLADSEQRLKLQHAQLRQTQRVPVRQVVARLKRTVSRTAAATGKRVQLLLDGADSPLDRTVLDHLTDALQHLLRNAVDHGIEAPDVRRQRGKPATGTIQLRVHQGDGTLRITCEDDGAGLDLPAIHAKARRLGLVDTGLVGERDTDATPDPATVARWILLPGFSTRDTVTELSGRGLGLDVVATQLRLLKGQLDIATLPGQGTCFTLQLPTNRAWAHALIVRSGDAVYALPAAAVVMALPAAEVQVAAGHLRAQGQSWPCRRLATLLGQPLTEAAAPAESPGPAVLVRLSGQTMALQVDAVLETRELLLQDMGRLLTLAPGLAGGALRPDGHVIFLLDLDGLQPKATGWNPDIARGLREQARRHRRRALIVDDSHSVRHVLMQTLADAGWQVLNARNGFEALSLLARERVDIVLTDLEMPQLDGLDMTRALRRRPEGRDLPVLMITSRDGATHRRRAQDAGVSRYLTKPVTEPQLLAAVAELVGASAREAAHPGDSAMV